MGLTLGIEKNVTEKQTKINTDKQTDSQTEKETYHIGPLIAISIEFQIEWANTH